MRRFQIVTVCLVASLLASAKGILPCMVYRHGLTNEQIDGILARRPDAQLRITAQDWRGMQYQLHRFANMTNYVEMIGSTQDCARVLLDLHDAAEAWRTRHGAVSNLYARTERELERAAERAREYAGAYADATNRLAASVADYIGASNRAARAEARHNAVVSWAEGERDKALLPTTKALWQSFIDRLKKEDE